MFRPAALLKKRLWHSWFLVKFAKFLKTPLNTFGGCFSHVQLHCLEQREPVISLCLEYQEQLNWISCQPKKGRPKFSSAQIFVTLGKFRHLGPTNNLGRRKFGFFEKFHIGVTFVFKNDISSFRLVNSHYIL